MGVESSVREGTKPQVTPLLPLNDREEAERRGNGENGKAQIGQQRAELLGKR